MFIELILETLINISDMMNKVHFGESFSLYHKSTVTERCIAEKQNKLNRERL